MYDFHINHITMEVYRMEYIYKEVNFTKYCPLCEEADTHEEKDPCNVCLFFPMNEHSEKPVYFKPKKK